MAQGVLEALEVLVASVAVEAPEVQEAPAEYLLASSTCSTPFSLDHSMA